MHPKSTKRWRFCRSRSRPPGRTSRERPGGSDVRSFRHLHRDPVREPVPALFGAADRVGVEHPAGVRGGMGRRRHQDDRGPPGGQRQRAQDELHAHRPGVGTDLDEEEDGRRAPLVLELGAHLRQAARLVDRSPRAPQEGAPEEGPDRFDHGGLRLRRGDAPLADARESLPGGRRGRAGAEPLLSPHGPARHGLEHRKGRGAHLGRHAGRQGGRAGAGLGEADPFDDRHRRRGARRVPRRRRCDLLLQHVHFAAGDRPRDAGVRDERRRAGLDRRPRRSGDPAPLAGEDGPDDERVPGRGVFGDRRDRGVSPRAELLPARLRDGPGLHRRDARPRGRPQRRQEPGPGHGGVPGKERFARLEEPGGLPRHPARPDRVAFQDQAARRGPLSRRLRRRSAGRRAGERGEVTVRRRTTALLPLALAAVIAAAAQPAKKAGRPSKQYTIEQFYATIGLRDASFSSDEKRILFSSNQTGVYNVYSVPVTGGAPTPLTSSATDTTYAVSYFPADDRVLYTHDQGGNELNHLYVRETDGKERDLTPGEKLKAEFDGWNGDRTAFWVETNERDPKFFDLYRYDAKSYERSLLYKNDAGYNIAAISPDGKRVALVKTNGTADSDIYLWNAATSDAKLITKHEAIADNTPQEFDPSSGSLYYLSNEGAEFARVRKYDSASGKSEDVEKPSWDPLFVRFSKNGRYRVTGINDDGRTVVHLLDTKTGKEVPLPKLPAGDVTAVRFADGETRLAFYVNGDRSPSNLYVYEFGAKAPVRLTDSLSKDIDPEDLVDSEVVRFKSFDGMVIPSIYYKPLQATARTRVPALVWVHGGPGGQTRKGYSATIQYLVNHGYAVLGINNRGSSGYGKSFYVADDQRHGKEPLRDCVEGKKYLSDLPYVDASRIGIIGGSYCGYMVLAALAFQPEEFAVG